MREFINVNDTIREDDHATIMAAIALAHEDGCNTIKIPRYNARTKTTVWSLKHAIEVPSDTTVLLDNCYMEQAVGSYENLFTNPGSQTDGARYHVTRNVAIIGLGNVTLSGGEHNNNLEMTTRKFGNPPMWYQHLIFWRNVDGARVENIHLQHQRWWAINHIFCRNISYKNIDFFAYPHRPNMDGIDLRIGCHHFTFENITGKTGDDNIAFTALSGKGERDRYVPGEQTHIHDITLRNIKADPHFCYPLRLLNHDGNQIFNINVDTIMDASDPNSGWHGGAGMSIGSPFYFAFFRAEHGDTHDIHVKNIYTRATAGIIMNHTIKDATFENVHTFDDSGHGIDTMIDGVQMENVKVKHLYVGGKQPKLDDGSELPRERYIGRGITFPKLQGTLEVEHMECMPVGVGVEVKGGGTVHIKDAKFEDAYVEVKSDEESKVILD